MSVKPVPDAPVEVTKAQQEEAAVQKAAGGSKRVFIVIPFGVLAIPVYFVVHTLGASRQSTDDAQIEADVVALAPRVGGQISSLNVTENATVKKGDVLFELDAADLRARVKQAEGELGAAKAQAASAEAQASV